MRSAMRRVFAGIVVATSTLLTSGCMPAWLFPRTDQTTVYPETDAARLIQEVYEPITWIMLVIFVVVELLVVYAALRFRRRPDDERPPEQVHGNTALEVGWTILPVVIVVALAFPTLQNLWALAVPVPTEDALVIKVTGKQWWWEFDYPEEIGVKTANELHLPSGRMAILELTSDNVIHSFWVPRLSGKRDLVPGRTQSIWFTPEEPGLYMGQCAELCGASHALMRFRVFVDEPGDFESWVALQKSPATSKMSDPGPQAMLSGGCIACHRVDFPGSIFKQEIGPVLTHIGSRSSIASGIMENTPENMRAWIKDPEGVKPGSLMPTMPLTDEQLDTLVDYLQSLE